MALMFLWNGMLSIDGRRCYEQHPLCKGKLKVYTDILTFGMQDPSPRKQSNATAVWIHNVRCGLGHRLI